MFSDHFNMLMSKIIFIKIKNIILIYFQIKNIFFITMDIQINLHTLQLILQNSNKKYFK
jgi:hypothetical protein